MSTRIDVPAPPAGTPQADWTPEQIVSAWRRGLETLDPNRVTVPGFIWREAGVGGREGVWRDVHAGMCAFLDAWGLEAVRMGYGTCALFGVHRLAGAVRADACGALITLYPMRVVEMTERTIVLQRGAVGSRMTFRGLTNPTESMPIWRFGRDGSPATPSPAAKRPR